MPYVESDGYQLWQSERKPKNINDVYIAAAESFARDVERYRYSHTLPGGEPDPAYHNDDFLAWAIARFDACKTGSGQRFTALDWSPDEAPNVRPIPEPEDRTNPRSYYDHTITPGGEA